MLIQELVQNLGNRSIRVRLGDEKLDYSFKTKQTNEEFAVKYSTLHENPVRQSAKAKWLDKEVFAGLLISFICALPSLMILSGPDPVSITFVCFTLGAVALTVWKFRQMRAKAYDVWVYGFKDGSTAFTLHASVPSEEKVSAFRAKLEDLTKKHNLDPTLAAGESVASQIHQLHRLFETGVLTEDEFQVAKTRILTEGDKPRAIGFKEDAPKGRLESV